MRIAEENCNMILLAAVTLVSAAVAGGAALVGPSDTKSTGLTDRTVGYAQPASAPDKHIINVIDHPPVRVVGAPFVPNTNPRER